MSEFLNSDFVRHMIRCFHDFSRNTTTANYAADVKRFEATLNSKQPDLLRYCDELTSTRDCIQAIRSIRDCRQHIQLAEMIVANRYATLLAERSTDSETAGGKVTSSAVGTLGSIPLTAPPSHVSDTAAATANSSVSL